MARLFPFRSDSLEVSQEPRLVDLDDTGADDVFAALSSDTARTILAQLYEEPGTATDVSEAADTSLQNARYHLDKLRDAGLIEEVDTWYSSRGTEMTVYAPTNEPLVVAAGREESTGMLRDAMKRILGSVGVLGLASLVVDRVARASTLGGDEFAGYSMDDGAEEGIAGNGGDGAGGDTAGDGDGASGNGDGARGGAGNGDGDGADVEDFEAQETGTPTSETPAGTDVATDTPERTVSETAVDDAATRTEEVTRTVEVTREAEVTRTVERTAEPTSTATEAGASATDRVVTGTANLSVETDAGNTPIVTDGGGLADAAAGLSPGLLFFTGGLLMLALAVGWWYTFRYRPTIG